jgi:hypothetical protein
MGKNITDEVYGAQPEADLEESLALLRNAGASPLLTPQFKAAIACVLEHYDALEGVEAE